MVLAHQYVLFTALFLISVGSNSKMQLHSRFFILKIRQFVIHFPWKPIYVKIDTYRPIPRNIILPTTAA